MKHRFIAGIMLAASALFVSSPLAQAQGGASTPLTIVAQLNGTGT